jgi:lipopolysaccharide transport system ATP-binding protein
VRIKSIELLYEGHEKGVPIYTTTPFLVKYQFWNLIEGQEINISTHFYDSSGLLIFNRWTENKSFEKGIVEGTLSIPGNFLNDGHFIFDFMLVGNPPKPIFNLNPALAFEIIDSRSNTEWTGKVQGVIRPLSIDFSISQKTIQ